MAKTILVTGAGRGIGLELARQYAHAGWRVFACCRSPEQADTLTRLAGESNGLLTVHRLEVTDTDRINALAEELRAEHVDILINNAGTDRPERQGFGQVDEKDWIEAFRVNTIAPLKMAEAFVAPVARSERRIIAVMSSMMGSIKDNFSGGYYAYRSTKAAVNMVVKNLSIDLKRFGIIAVALHPGWVKTKIGGPAATLSPRESVAGLHKVLAALKPEDSGRFLTYEGRELPW